MYAKRKRYGLDTTHQGTEYHPAPKKTEPSRELPAPKTQKKLETLMVAIQFFGKFTKDFSKGTDGLKMLMNKHNGFGMKNEAKSIA